MLDASAVAAAVRAGQISAVEVCREALERAATDEMGCFWFLRGDEALAEAARLDAARARGLDPGPLAGVPLAIKDCFDVEGLPTTVGVQRLDRPSAIEDATAVARLRRHGAIVVGKAAMHQLAWGMSGQAPGFPACRNPLDPTLMPGGSSSGSAAAVAANIVPLALGTDSGGSVRQPASWCGVVGLKPALGAIPLDGCLPMARSLDTGGVIARSVRDCVTALGVLTASLPPAVDERPRRVGVLESAFADCDRIVERACWEALRLLADDGASLDVAELPWEKRSLGPVYAAELATDWGERVTEDPAAFADDVREGVRTGNAISAVAYLRCLRTLERLREEARVAVERFDVVACPTVPILPLRLEESDPVARAGRSTRIFNGLGWPAVSIPCGRTPAGLSVGLQLAAPPGREATLLAAATRAEQLFAG